MKFRTTLITLFFSIFIISMTTAQVYYPMSFSIVDKSGIPLKGVNVSIKELGFQSGTSGSDGKVFFQDVPVGEIHYIAVLSGYNGTDGTFNITSEIKSNTLRIVLAKIPPQKTNLMLVSGEVVNKDGDDINTASVELRAGSHTQKVLTDESGSFNIEFDTDAIKYNVPEFILEVTKNDCKTKDKFVIPKSNYIYKEIIIDCLPGEDTTSRKPDWKKKFGEWDFELLECKKDGNSITCSFKVISNYRDRTLRIQGNYSHTGHSKLYDNLSNEYLADSAKLGDKKGKSYADKKLIANIPVTGSVTFSNISTQAKEISLFQLNLQSKDLSVKSIEFRNVPIK